MSHQYVDGHTASEGSGDDGEAQPLANPPPLHDTVQLILDGLQTLTQRVDTMDRRRSRRSRKRKSHHLGKFRNVTPKRLFPEGGDENQKDGGDPEYELESDEVPPSRVNSEIRRQQLEQEDVPKQSGSDGRAHSVFDRLGKPMNNDDLRRVLERRRGPGERDARPPKKGENPSPESPKNREAPPPPPPKKGEAPPPPPENQKKDKRKQEREHRRKTPPKKNQNKESRMEQRKRDERPPTVGHRKE